MTAARHLNPASEAALAARWAAGLPGPLRLEDGRLLRVIFPGIAAGASGPDFTGAILEADGDLLSGAVELHLKASSWRSHGHATDPAYAAVVLHAVAENDTRASAILTAAGRAIPILVLPPALALPGAPGFTPPCALERARGLDPAPALERLGLRRLRIKAARIAPLAASEGPAQALYTLLLETLAGPANREAFASLARTLPLAALLERAEVPGIPRAVLLAAELGGAAARLPLHRAGLRPTASPARRLEAAAYLIALLWPPSTSPRWPARLAPGAPPLPRLPGIGAALAIELQVNAILPAALAASAWPEPAVEAAWAALRTPGTYGRLRPLESWLGGGSPVFTTASRLQGGLLLQSDYCTRGRCGRCPLTS